MRFTGLYQVWMPIPITPEARCLFRETQMLNTVLDEIDPLKSIGESSRLIAFLFAELGGILNGALAAAAPSTVDVDLRVLRGI